MRNRFLSLATALLLLGAAPVSAGDLLLKYDFDPATSVLTLSLPADPKAYYTLEWTTDFLTFTNVGASLGSPGPVWSYSVAVGPQHGFFRVQSHSVFDPKDTDHDGIDDRYELQHPNCLDPLNYHDASQPCLTNGMSNYAYYLRDLLGGQGTTPQFYSREASVFNLGAPTARLEAISKEVSVYSANPGSGPPTSDILQVYSREVTTWNFGSPSAPVEAISREATVWNFGSPSAHIEAISKEVSVYSAYPGSGPPMTEFNQVYSREMTVFNFGAPTATWEAISREVSVLNFQDPQQ